ncbi:MAG: hypothetical protein EBQ94_12800 [Flavobacteriales bacterium]|nr:hypothetical protein [Flavobacteriales bacterium]NCA20313.1 hypothetical protein [Crocinitomicaceae bacterium]
MKTLFSFLLLTLMTYNFVGLFPTYSYFESSNKIEIEKRIKVAKVNNDFTELNLDQKSFDELVWVKKNEFRYNGHLYDFVNKKIDKEGNIIVYVIDDTKEKHRIDNYNNHIGNNSSNSSPTKNTTKLTAFFSQLYLPVQHQFEITSIYFEANMRSNHYYFSKNLFRFDREIPSPPPQFS